MRVVSLGERADSSGAGTTMRISRGLRMAESTDAAVEEKEVSSAASVDTDGFGGSAASEEVVLDVKDLQTHFTTRWGVVKAVDGVTYHVKRGETLGIVGESGSGKSVTALSLMRLVPSPPGKIVGGEVVLGGSQPSRTFRKSDDIGSWW